MYNSYKSVFRLYCIYCSVSSLGFDTV